MNPNTNIQENLVKKQGICPICGLDQQEFRKMFGLEPDESTGCEMHEPIECPVCAKELR